MDTIEEWFNAYRERLTDYAIALTKDFDGAEDIVQTVFIKLMRVNLSEIDIPFVYLKRAVKNAFIDARKSKKYRTISYHIREFTIGDYRFKRVFYYEDGECYSTWRMKKDEKENTEKEAHLALTGLFTLLSERERRVATLFYLGGVTTDKVGEIMGISGSTVRQYLFRIRRKIRKVLEDDMGVCNERIMF